MALGTITVLDGNSIPITIQVLGTTSPFTWGHVLIDGVAGGVAAQVTPSNALKVDGSGVTQPVSFSGGITISSGSVQIVGPTTPAIVTGAGALKVDGTGATFTVGGTVTANIGSPGVLALETGNLATVAGSFIAQGTALGTNKELMVAGSVTTSPPTYANGQISPLSLTPSGLLRVDSSSAPVSTINQGGTVASAAWPMAIASGGTINPTATVKAGGVLPVAGTDGALVVTNRDFNANGPNIALNSSPVTCAVDQYRTYKGITETTITSSTAETTIIASISSKHVDLYGLVLANSGSSATKVTIKDATAGTTRMVFEVPAGDTRGFMVTVDSAIPQSAVTNNWTATCGTSVASLDVTAMWVQNA